MNNQELIKPSKNTDKTLRMLSGIILAIFSLFIIISLFTYNPKDPDGAFHQATTQRIILDTQDHSYQV